MRGERIVWADRLRGISMMAILFFHLEAYYRDYDGVPYSMYVENALAAFFFVSGYLFTGSGGTRVPDFRHKLVSILRGLLLPYIIFTSALALPKAAYYGGIADLRHYALRILTGEASWFVSSLIVVQLYFLVVLFVARRRTAVAALLMVGPVLAWRLLMHRPPGNIIEFSVIPMVYVYAGYAARASGLMAKAVPSWLSAAACLALVLLKWYEWSYGMDMTMYTVGITSYPLFFLDTFLSLLVMVQACRTFRLPHVVEYTGSHSLVYYFLSGGVPLLVSRAAAAFHEPTVALEPLLFIIVYLITTALTWLVYRYLPWTVGKWRCS